LKKKKPLQNEVSIEIDKLTNSIKNAQTGNVFDTEFHRITKAGKGEIKKGDWLFNWHDEIKYAEREVYKLTIEGEPGRIQGLVSFVSFFAKTALIEHYSKTLGAKGVWTTHGDR